jgi:tyrosine-protein phosphatase YwqE
LASAGLVGILSHPERNLGILNQPGILGPLVERGCLLQVTAGSLTGAFGPRIQERAESLVRDGLVHFVATDAHGTKGRPPVLSTAFQRVAKLAGEEAALDLCCRNPAMVVAGGSVPPGRRRGKKGTGPICRNGPEGALHKLDLSPFFPRVVKLAARGWFRHGFASEPLSEATI